LRLPFAGILNGSAPVMIPGSGNLSPQGHSPLSQSGANGFGSLNQQNDTLENVSFISLKYTP
jgi:hypothetical protein